MKLVYLHRMGGKSGVDRKIYSQVRSLSDVGVNSEIIGIYEQDFPIMPDKYIKLVPISTHKSGFMVISKLRREYSFNNILMNTIKTLGTDDFLYMRPPYPFLSVSRLLRKPRKCKIVIEYQDIEPLEYRLKGKYWYLPLDSLFGNSIRKYSDAIVGVTEEITEYQLGRSGNPKKRHITIGNGIDVHSINIRNCPPYPETELHLICVANVNKWHGLDRFIEGLAKYQGHMSVVIHIAGEGPELLHLKRLSSDLGMERNVFFHGYLTGKMLDELYDHCHIAVGSMAHQRSGLTQSSTLKAREYCAKGIPFILSSVDPDFFYEAFPYMLKVPPNDTPIDIEMVIEFSKKVLADPAHPEKMRQYAFKYLDWSVKMLKLKDFLTLWPGE